MCPPSQVAQLSMTCPEQRFASRSCGLQLVVLDGIENGSLVAIVDLIDIHAAGLHEEGAKPRAAGEG